jgi:hypothetical protein
MTSKFTAEDRARIIAEAEAIIARTADIANAPPASPVPLHDDPLERWARNMPKPEPPPRPRKLDTAPAPAPVPVDWVAARIAQAVADERAFIFEVVAQFVTQMRNELVDEIEQAYGRQFNMVRLDLDALRHEIRKFAGVGVLELPKFLEERRRAN